METVSGFEGAPLSQVERVVDVFIAPTKTFTDVRRSASWWLPWLLVAAFSMVFSYTVLHKVGIPALVDSVVRATPSVEERLSGASPEDAAKIRQTMEMQFKFMYAYPIIGIVLGLIAAGVLVGSANFIFAGRATYGQMLAVWFYGTLPLLLVSVLTVVTLYAGMSTDGFNIKNPIGTNIGFYLQESTAPKWLVTLLSSVDVFAIWTAIVLSIGVAVVAGIKRSAGAIVVFGWWAIYVLFQAGVAAVTG